MTYLQFLLVFIVPVIGIFIFLKPWANSNVDRRMVLVSIATLSAVAFVYTTPWDNYLVYKGVWNYPNDRVLFSIGFVPFEEYMFFVLQTVMTGLFFFQYSKKFSFLPAGPSAGGAAFWLIVSGAGLFCLFNESTFYLGLILAWASPVLGLQWVFGGKVFERAPAHFLKAVLIPTVYLWICDSIAIYLEIWSISEKFTTGLKLGVLPVEEALFFLITNLLVVQGLWLFVSHRHLSDRLFQPKAG